jgi:Beta-ketoacyl synthase, N-terminal domain
VSLEPASILGIGAITPLGRDLKTIAQRLSAPPQPAEIFAVDDQLLADPTTSKGLRRADRFVKMAALAALDAWKNVAPPEAMDRVGLIVTSGLGPHGRGFKFLDGILDCGDAEALPTDFSHSVHGAAASYIAGLLDLRGPSLSTTDFSFGFEQAILLAQTWLSEKTCDRVIVGAVEELGKVLIECAPKLLPTPRISPAPGTPAFGSEAQARRGEGWGGGFNLGEGAVFLTLGPQTIPTFATINANPQPITPDLLIIDHPMIFPQPFPPAGARATFTPYFGHTASNSAFQTLGALLTLQSTFDTAMTFRTSSNSSASILIKRTGRTQ